MSKQELYEENRTLRDAIKEVLTLVDDFEFARLNHMTVDELEVEHNELLEALYDVNAISGGTLAEINRLERDEDD